MRWKPFAFNDVCLSVPEGWELDRFAGDSRRGDLALDDGGRVRLEAQWGPDRERDPARLEERLLGGKNPPAVARRFTPAPGCRALLAREATGETAYFLRVREDPAGYQLLRVFDPPGDPEAFARRLLRGPGPELAPRGRPWCFFATRFLLPPGFLLARGELRAGCMRLDFTRRGRELTIWDFSLLERIERGQDPAEFAAGIVKTEFGKRYKVLEDELNREDDRADFLLPTRMRRRWLLHPRHLLAGNRRAWVRGVPNRRGNRFAVIFHRFRARDEDDGLPQLVASLRNPETIAW